MIDGERTHFLQEDDDKMQLFSASGRPRRGMRVTVHGLCAGHLPCGQAVNSNGYETFRAPGAEQLRIIEMKEKLWKQ